ncbi:carotenoid biosynthesis protein [Polaribacter sp.]|uniref:carotenoid biosynthesis protein n=1 Tax=Polaribacter sp. TaxID=1920175 RepID=UPI004048C963
MKLKTAIIILGLFHVSGIIAILATPFRELFLSLTPLNLLISASLLFIFHTKLTKIQIISFAVIAILGYFVEVVGVNTGKIFGIYTYGPVLGWKLFETPLMIGINWIMLTYSITYSWSNFIENKWLLAILSAISLVLLDVIIEPVAVIYNFWRWENEIIPIQNYVAWGIVSFLFCLILANFKKQSTNKFAPYLIIAQILFFSILLLFS